MIRGWVEILKFFQKVGGFRIFKKGVDRKVGGCSEKEGVSLTLTHFKVIIISVRGICVCLHCFYQYSLCFGGKGLVFLNATSRYRISTRD